MTGIAARRSWLPYALGIAGGAAYGLFIRSGAILFPRSRAFEVMTIGFLLFLPFAMGFIAVFIVERSKPQSIGMWLAISCGAVLAGITGTVLVLWEGLICAVMFAPIGLVSGMIGGLAAGFILRSRHSRTNISLACVMILPLLITPWEERVLRSPDLRTVESAIDIRATPDMIWQNIERVPPIAARELPASWSHAIGFPNPVEATLSNEGRGGVRHATFEGGVLFVETIDVWEPKQRLGFSIHAQTAGIPPTTLDEHVVVGGRFFDVLHGEYSLESLPNGETRLHLVSRHCVSTDFNWYAHLWTDAVMRDLQKRILEVVRNRCERPIVLDTHAFLTEPERSP